MANQIMLGDHLPRNKRILTGRDVGEHARERYRLDDLDQTSGTIKVVIPEKIWTLSASYFLGCFGNSVRKLGEDQFRKKYIFECDDVFIPSIEDGIYRATHTSDKLENTNPISAGVVV